MTSLKARKNRGGGAAVNTNGQNYIAWIGEAGQINMCAQRVECENVVNEVHNLNPQAHSVDDPFNI